MKKQLIMLAFLLAITLSATYADIPKAVKRYRKINCQLKPIHRGARPDTSPPLSPLVRIREGTSTNWSGYAAATNLTSPQPGSVKKVTGSWIVPTLSPVQGNAYSSIWVGIDGYASSSVEQIGTEHDWINGSQRNYAWFEMYPKAAYQILNFPCRPGQQISAAVTYAGNGVFQLVIFNKTKKVYYTVPSSYTKSTSAQRNSAEWIVEAPTSSSVLPLANFGIAKFTQCNATINGVIGSINNSHWENDAITMETSGSTVKAQPSGLSSDGSSFNVTWHHK